MSDYDWECRISQDTRAHSDFLSDLDISEMTRYKKNVRFYLDLCGNNTKEMLSEANGFLIVASLIRCKH